MSGKYKEIDFEEAIERHLLTSVKHFLFISVAHNLRREVCEIEVIL